MKGFQEQPLQWLTDYLDRKTDELLAALDAAGVFFEPRQPAREAVRQHVLTVMQDMSVHLSHPQPEQEKRK